MDKIENFICLKTLIMDSKEEAFTKGKIYTRNFPEIWPPPGSKVKYSLINNQKVDHFMSTKFLKEYFDKVEGL